MTKNKTFYISKKIIEDATDEQLELWAAKLDLDSKEAIITDYAVTGQKDTAYVKNQDGTYTKMDYTDYLLQYGETDIEAVID